MEWDVKYYIVTRTVEESSSRSSSITLPVICETKTTARNLAAEDWMWMKSLLKYDRMRVKRRFGNRDHIYDRCAFKTIQIDEQRYNMKNCKSKDWIAGIRPGYKYPQLTITYRITLMEHYRHDCKDKDAE